MASPDPDPEPGLTDKDLTHFNRPPPPDPTVREYTDVQSGERRPETETVPIERVADDLRNIRDAERREREEQNNRDLTDALDHLQRQVTEQPQQPQQAQQPEAQP